MSKALPITVAVLLGGAALVPVYYATKHPAAPTTSSSMSKDASPIEKVSYALGHEFGSQTPPELDIDAFVTGIRAGFAKQPRAYTDEELQAASVELQKELEKKQKTELQQSDASAEKFLSENAKKPGVITTASGLQYKVIKEGTGKQPTADSMVTVHYTGKLINGTEFDSSYKRNEPAVFPLKGVIPGWTEGLQLMKEGGKATLYIPAKLGYGAQSSAQIPANSTLIFDVELVKVQ
ncbi:FKBP-type peptidyl-prolyl cis-trans isomerase [Acinetobacter rudis]|uniref:Peptidyl-prolyl cis-trans isomerase n=1 Tax=Acinetobacter rudis TaxID=632955 RepID=A0AAW8JAI9_9GAMM|nr:FKBP-type peptidyl-prolyl cis-trans isomerase [Acinetobacter rudis]MDQ8935913.1 FKBP-type peptidyl-prolyl cis-trans isomerase [Acinetobacter rudis]MDQ8953642.1 FKBP-type peptidyl-prolyl cis-trans isomerase [Acinetobacter rudis]MDQ9018176.1 FKBP-type peptidyl-prolyl cis-trans isomerase [Acinetobacter rudis]